MLFSLIILIYFGLNATNLPSEINSSQTWNILGSPYVLSGQVTIAKGIEIKVLPGVEIKSSGDYAMIVKGTLV